MGRAPSIIIIARHGARLDAEDTSWHLTSAAPYDPPLSYGGWTQTRALGARIASILHERDLSLDEEDKHRMRRASEQDGFSPSRTQATPPKKRKRKIVIHSSPFLRCVQSSIAISAGMAQYQGNLQKFETARTRIAGRTSRLQTPTRSRTLDSGTLESKLSLDESTSKAQEHSAGYSQRRDLRAWKPTLRVDGFLGEWLSTEYYEFITAPPCSKMMIAGAKADLIRRATPIHGARLPQPLQYEDLNTDTEYTSTMKFSVSDRKSIPQSGDEASTEGEADTKDYAYAGAKLPRPLHTSFCEGYTPPLPTYAISSSESIPPGYVAHARDACIQVDFQWDSMDEPQNWGDGGQHGEEWRSMHTRFRKGLMDMITWYKINGPYYDPQESLNAKDEEREHGHEEDLILVLVTHGAGCNALIGALTNQPVLLDVGMASLTMAVHKGAVASSTSAPLSRRSSVPSSNHRRRSSVDCTQADEYDMKLVASMEHLRAGQDPLKIPQLQSPALSAIPEDRRGGSHSSTSGSDGVRTPETAHLRSQSTAVGSIRRSRATTFVDSSRASPSDSVRSSSGLWGSSSVKSTEATDPLSSRQSSLDHRDDATALADETSEMVVQSPVDVSVGAVQAHNQKGLWGSAPKTRPVRRWTLMDQTR